MTKVLHTGVCQRRPDTRRLCGIHLRSQSLTLYSQSGCRVSRQCLEDTYGVQHTQQAVPFIVDTGCFITMLPASVPALAEPEQIAINSLTGSALFNRTRIYIRMATDNIPVSSAMHPTYTFGILGCDALQYFDIHLLPRDLCGVASKNLTDIPLGFT